MRPEAFGAYGQMILIASKDRVVIVRLGVAYTPLGDILALERLTRESLAALSPDAASAAKLVSTPR